MNSNEGLTLLKEEEIWENKKLEVLEKYGTIAAISDLAILTGGSYSFEINRIPDDGSMKGRTCSYFTQSSDILGNIIIGNEAGNMGSTLQFFRQVAIRPIIKNPDIFDLLWRNKINGYNDCEEVELGEYPQYVPDSDIQEVLENEYHDGNMKKTGKNYTFNKANVDDSKGFQPINYDEYEYNNKKYIRIESASSIKAGTNKYVIKPFILSDGKLYTDYGRIWIKVSPVRWLIDRKTKTLISKRCLLSGIPFQSKDKDYDGNFSATVMKEYLDNYMIKDLGLDNSLSSKKTNSIVKNTNKERNFKQNPYNLTFDSVSEEEIIKGSIESGVAVFLH